jgi:lipopolysaccharide transport system permease protein
MPGTEKNSSLTKELPEHIYSADRKSGLVTTLKSFVKEFRMAHALGYRFAERTIKSRYRQSLLGILWAFLPPIATAIIWIILRNSNVVNIREVGAPYPVFVITGTMLWSVFANAVMMPMQIMQTNRNILVKINFPREAILVNAFYEILFNAAIAFLIIIAELLIFQVHITWHSLLFIPCVFLLIMLGMSIGLLLLPFSLLYRDIQFALPSLLQFAMYLTPVVYAKPVYEGIGKLLNYNPVTPVLTAARAWLLNMPVEISHIQIALVAGISAVLLLIGIVLQRITVEILIERMGT